MRIQIALPVLNNQTNILPISLKVEPSDLVIKVKDQIYQLFNQKIGFDDVQKKKPQLLTRQAISPHKPNKFPKVIHHNDSSDEEPLDYGDNPKFTAFCSAIGSSLESLQLLYRLKVLHNDKRLEEYDINELSVLHLQVEKTDEKVEYLNF